MYKRQDQKDRLIKTMKQQRDFKKEEQALMKEWDHLTISIEQIQINQGSGRKE